MKQITKDYNKEPIVIKDYSKIISVGLDLFSIFNGSIMFGFFYETIIDKYPIDRYSIMVFCFIAIFLEIIAIWFIYYFYTKRHKSEIHFTNNSINFYENGELKRVSNNENLKNIICKPFWRKISKADKGDKIFLFVILLMTIIFSKGLIFAYLFFIYISNIFFKFVIHLMVKKKLNDFSVFPIIIFDKPLYPNYFLSSGAYIMSGYYYFVYIFDQKQYQEIKTYFLDTKNINIDNIKKRYFF